MKRFWLRKQIWLPAAREEVFAFFADPMNLDRLTPAWLRFEIVTKQPVAMRPGTLLDYRLRLRGLPIRWQSKISVWEPPDRFVDEQTKGPYSLWIHQHRFEESNGGTLVRDDVEYAVPGGRLVQKLLVAPDLEKIFRYRHATLQQLFTPESQKPITVR
jgi:ligand-binding SRPBCC domain-containing protein